MSTQNPVSSEPEVTPHGSVNPVSADQAAKADEPLGEPGLAALKSEREARAAAEKQAKDALAKVKAFEDAQKTEAEKQAERLAEFERENAELKSAKTRAEVAATKQIPSELFAGPASDSPEDLAAFADALVAWRGEQAPPEQARFIVPAEGSGQPTLPLNGDGLEAALKQAIGIN